MGKELQRPRSGLNNVNKKVDASSSKNAERIVEVRKRDTAADSDNEFVLHEQPSDEQMNERYTNDSDYREEEAD